MFCIQSTSTGASIDIGTLIAHHRSGKRVLLSNVERDTGLPSSYIQSIENGDVEPTVDDLFVIANSLKMTLGELLSDPNSMPAREHAIELPYEEYYSISMGTQSVLILRNAQGYRVGDSLRICCENYPEFYVGVKAVHMCEELKSIPFSMLPGFVIVEMK